MVWLLKWKEASQNFRTTIKVIGMFKAVILNTSGINVNLLSLSYGSSFTKGLKAQV